MSRRRCPQCDKPVARSASWCPSCGASLAASSSSEGAQAAEGSPSLVIGGVVPPKTRTRETKFVLAGLLVLAIVAVGVVVASLNSTSYADNGQQTSAVSRSAVLTRASEASQEAFVYTATTVSDDVAKAAANMTPSMAAKYKALLTDQVKSDIASRGQEQKAEVKGAGLVSLTSDTARVLELLVQTTTISGSTNEQDSAERLIVTLKKVNGVWLIDGMDPF